MKRPVNISKDDALVIANIQIDFLPGGALPVSEGDIVIPVVNDYIKIFKKAGASIFAIRDWHPQNHVSFTTQGGQWPPHCVQQSEGAKFHPELKLPEETVVISKATDTLKDTHSSFEGTGLAQNLKMQGIYRIFVCGFATEYCILNTVLDSPKLSFETVLLLDAVRGINAKPNDASRAIEKMVSNGAEQATLDDFPDLLDVPFDEKPRSDRIAEKPLSMVELKKKARMRPRGPYKKVRTERG